jgi:periplasmic protein TonB
MGYTALLFCPDDKTVRTVTQVLSELEFAVEACIEPFAAVKKLMGTHFDAVVVDCDNEQNATLLFKSARNSTSNQTSLAVAVVEGQAGVAKAFRIGANLVLTKPINIEQAKGTLRVARGLLRKSEPGKPVAPTATMSAPAPTAPASAPAPAASTVAKPAPKPAPAAKPAATTVVKTAAPGPIGGGPLPPRPVQTPAAKPAAPAAWPAAAAASSKPKTQDGTVPEIGTKAPPEPSAPKIASAAIENPQPPAAEIKLHSAAHASTNSGSASAPAPALEPQETKIPEKSAEISTASVAEKPAEAASSQESNYVGAAPTFSFGASSEEPSSGGNKKIIIGVAAALVVAAAGYFGWTQFKGHDTAPTTPAPQSAVTAPQPKPAIQQAAVPTTPAATTPAPNPTTTAAVPATTPDANTESEEPAATPSPKPAKNAASASSKPSAPAEPEPAPMVVKGGKVPAVQTQASSADAPAPSMAGMTPGAAPPPDLVTTPTNAETPVLQTLSISQGVSQGLLYKKVSPVYPQNALRMRIEGSVELMATISKSGDITHIKTLSGDPQLTKAATDAVKQWKYKPYLLNGEPVEIQTQITVNFKLPH